MRYMRNPLAYTTIQFLGMKELIRFLCITRSLTDFSLPIKSTKRVKVSEYFFLLNAFFV